MKPKREELCNYFKFHPNQPESSHFVSNNVYSVRDDDSGAHKERLSESFCENKQALFCNICIAFASKQESNMFLRGFSDWKHIHQRLREHSQKHQECVHAYLRHVSNRTVSDMISTTQLTQTKQQIVKRREVLDRIVSIVRLIGKRGMSYRGKSNCESVASLRDDTVDHGTFLEIALLLAKYDDVLKENLESIINTSNKTRAARNTFLSKTTINAIIIHAFSDRMKNKISAGSTGWILFYKN